uniref:GNAT family N-acetyltransferase n=1 Tax=Thermoanaerobaculum aquaticum TaxID=1312852 RepID=A0A7C2NC31_9BACT
MQGSYRFERVGASADELQEVVALLTTVWPKAGFDLSYLRWLYRQNPVGVAIGFNAWYGSSLAAHYVVIPCRVIFDGGEVKAALSLNTATHPAHQGRGLFTRLASLTYEVAASEGFHHIFGVGNARSTPGLVEKLGFQLVGRLEARLSLWPPSLKRDLGRSVRWRRLWSSEELAWRLANPRGQYSWRRWRATTQYLAHTGHWGIRAILGVVPGSPPTTVVPSSLRRLRGWYPFIWLGFSNELQFCRLLSFDLPVSWRPSPLNFVYLPLSSGSGLLDRSTVEFSTIDFDAY